VRVVMDRCGLVLGGVTEVTGREPWAAYTDRKRRPRSNLEKGAHAAVVAHGDRWSPLGSTPVRGRFSCTQAPGRA
jgi:hypothetical protein